MWGSLPSDPSSSSQGETSGFVTTSPPSSPSLLTSLTHKLEETFKIAKDIKDTILGPSLSDLRVPPRPTKPGTAGQVKKPPVLENPFQMSYKSNSSPFELGAKLPCNSRIANKDFQHACSNMRRSWMIPL
jgi:hypothetical protein